MGCIFCIFRYSIEDIPQPCIPIEVPGIFRAVESQKSTGTLNLCGVVNGGVEALSQVTIFRNENVSVSVGAAARIRLGPLQYLVRLPWGRIAMVLHFWDPQFYK